MLFLEFVFLVYPAKLSFFVIFGWEWARAVIFVKFQMLFLFIFVVLHVAATKTNFEISNEIDFGQSGKSASFQTNLNKNIQTLNSLFSSKFL